MSKESKVEKPESLFEKQIESNPPVKKATPSFGMPLNAKKDLEVTLAQNLAVVLTQKAFSQLFGYAYATEVEVSLLGIVDRQGGVFKVSEFFLVEQSGSSARTETDPDAIGELIERLIAENRTDDAKKIRCWAHSHPGMDVFWSHTDDTNCRRLSSDWLVSIVVSDGFKIRCRVDVSWPVPISLDLVPAFCEPMIDTSIITQCAAEVKEKIKTMPVFSVGTIADELREKGKKKDRPKDEGVELVEYCEECGAWHEDDQCPLRFLSGYELAHRESRMATEEGSWAEDGFVI